MKNTATPPRVGHAAPRAATSGGLQAWLPRFVLAPSVAISLFFVYGFMLWTFVLSLTSSRMLPSYDFVGFGQYARLMQNERWWVASTNLMIFGTLFVLICLVIGALLAMLLDQKIRQEGALRTIYLYCYLFGRIKEVYLHFSPINRELLVHHAARPVSFKKLLYFKLNFRPARVVPFY